jgi:nitrogen-specific signal transduction histidine kinase
MNARTICIGYTRDELLRRKLGGWLSERHVLTWAEDIEAVALSVQQHAASVLLLDLRVPQALELLEWLPKGRPSCVTICFAEGRSRPALLAEQLGVLEIQPLQPERKMLQAAVHRAAEMSELRMDNAILQTRPLPSPEGRSADGRSGQRPSSESLLDLARAAQCLDDPDALLQQAVEMVSRTVHCARVGLYLQDEDGKTFRLRAGVGAAAEAVPITASSDFAQWVRLHGQIAARSTLGRVQRQEERLMLAKTLDALNAEAVVPLSGKKGLLGWLLAGAPVSGGSLEPPELKALMRLGQDLGFPIEKSQACRNSGLRQKLLEMLFDALPSGVVALNPSLEVLWLNRTAETLLEVTFEGAVGSSLDCLGPGLSELVQAWQDKRETTRQIFRTPSGIPLEFSAEPLSEAGQSSSTLRSGLLIMLQDATAAEQLREQREISYRREILSEMAASVAFEIRSPLASIKTFTQLLPERMADVSFTQRYRDLVGHEVDRLSELSNSICSLSNFRSRDAGAPRAVFAIPKLIELVRCLAGAEWANIEPQVEANLPSMEGNCARLAECICHLLANAREATRDQPPAPIRLSLARINVTKNVQALEIAVSDHRVIQKVGSGVDNTHLGSEDDRERAHLRLTFASEIVREFAGDMSLATSENGVTIKLLLPICCDEETANR